MSGHCLFCFFAAKKASGKSKEEVQREKKLELEKRLEGVQQQLGQTKKSKKGHFLYSRQFSLLLTCIILPV